ncbi:catechol 1,2-dioxygenase [Corynebacterium accolens]|uniref:catechol 1,2-dioxygenase n=1 Tax=Corynebacterium TaxID=1716 RepID=UPI001E3FED58|nr:MULTISPECIES: catechol 1,2-dioxygenase [Corynebacterium]WKS66373.1 catechol 1,2-dioxygenase [Corynebacterium accolens]
MKKTTALAAIAVSTFSIGSYVADSHRLDPESQATGGEGPHPIVNELGLDSGTYELTPTESGSVATWNGNLA